MYLRKKMSNIKYNLAMERRDYFTNVTQRTRSPFFF